MGAEEKFEWREDHGFYPVDPADAPYDQSYFDKYAGYARTELGTLLTEERVRLVRRHAPETVVVDVGIGCGQFVEAMNRDGMVFALGFDVNPAGVRWLRERGIYSNVYSGNSQVLTFWDSLEHIERPELLLERCTEYAFVSLPVFLGREHALASKHFRPDEHYWYWTVPGFERFARGLGFEVVEHSHFESDLGREGIDSFALRRVE